jgi:hypothetical protein
MNPSWVPGLPGQKGGALWERYKNSGLLGGGPNVDSNGNLGSKTEAILRTFGTKTVKIIPADTIKYNILDLKTQSTNNNSTARTLMTENENLKRVSDPSLTTGDKIKKVNNNTREIKKLEKENQGLNIKAENEKSWYDNFVERMKESAKNLKIVPTFKDVLNKVIPGASAAEPDKPTRYDWQDLTTGQRGIGKVPGPEELAKMRGGQPVQNHLPINKDIKTKPAILTVYNPDPRQTDSTPDIGSLNRKMKFGDVAIGNINEINSAKKAYRNGEDTFVVIPELSKIKTPYGGGVFRVNDGMNKRYDGDNKIDVFIPNEMIGTDTEKIIRKTPKATYAYR